MDEGERKEDSSLPPDYISLAQLQERWLRKQEERKLKEKQEEKEKRGRDARTQKEKNRNQSRRAKMAGGFVRDTGVTQEKGKGKEILTGGPGNGGENDKGREVIRGGRTREFKSAAAVEEKAKELGGGDQSEGAEIVAEDAVRAGVLSWEGGRGVEEICNVSVVEVLPQNWVKKEIADTQTTDLRGGFRGNARNRGSRRVNELEQSETGLDLEKRVENGRGHGSWRGSERGSNGGYRDRSIRLKKEFRPVLKGKSVNSELEKKAEDELSMVCSEISSLSVGDRNGICGRNSKDSNKAKEDIFVVEGSNGDKVTSEIEKKVDHEAGESANIGKHMGVVKGYQRNENRRTDFDQGRRQSRPDICAEKDRIEGEGSNGKRRWIEKKVDHEVLAGENANIGENRGGVKGYQKNKKGKKKKKKGGHARHEISAEEDIIEGEGSNGSKVALENEKMDHEVLAGETAKTGENTWVRNGYRKNENRRRDFGQERRYARTEMSSKEDRIEGEGSNGNHVALEIEKKVDHGFLAGESAKVGENKGVMMGYPRNKDPRRGFGQERTYTRPETSAEEKRIEGESSNGDKVPLEIEKKVDREVFAGKSAKTGEKRGVVKGYQRNERLRRDFDQVRSYSRLGMNSGESGKAWVKKEEKLGA